MKIKKILVTTMAAIAFAGVGTILNDSTDVSANQPWRASYRFNNRDLRCYYGYNNNSGKQFYQRGWLPRKYRNRKRVYRLTDPLIDGPMIYKHRGYDHELSYFKTGRIHHHKVYYNGIYPNSRNLYRVKDPKRYQKMDLSLLTDNGMINKFGTPVLKNEKELARELSNNRKSYAHQLRAIKKEARKSAIAYNYDKYGVSYHIRVRGKRHYKRVRPRRIRRNRSRKNKRYQKRNKRRTIKKAKRRSYKRKPRVYRHKSRSNAQNNSVTQPSNDTDSNIQQDLPEFRAETLSLINQDRTDSTGKDPLQESSALDQIAQIRANQASTPAQMNQTDPHMDPATGKAYYEEVGNQLGYNVNAFGSDNYSASGENLAWGDTTPEDFNNAWYTSEKSTNGGHYQNIVGNNSSSAHYKLVGIGVYHNTGAEVFADNVSSND